MWRLTNNGLDASLCTTGVGQKNQPPHPPTRSPTITRECNAHLLLEVALVLLVERLVEPLDEVVEHALVDVARNRVTIGERLVDGVRNEVDLASGLQVQRAQKVEQHTIMGLVGALEATWS